MHARLPWSALLILFLTLGLPVAAHAQQDGRGVVLTTRDGLTVYGDLYASGGVPGHPFILLFHQGGANGRAEYAPILPRLRAEGFNLLVLDQRRGGDRFGGHNRTVAAHEGATFSYCEALPDLEAALAFVRERDPSARPILWGSSYSAALVIQVAAVHSDAVAGVLAFSPASGEPMDGCRPEPLADGLTVPLLVLRPQSEAARESVAAQLAAFAEQGHQTYVADPGTHGSSMLAEERAGGDVEPTWRVVLDFLRDVTDREAER
ncbi:MAG: alpha/beta hydrolase [Rhodothermaceae bacterium]|nr:alpha/beta hydrolase [Rhodothermaceae bacterium]